MSDPLSTVEYDPRARDVSRVAVVRAIADELAVPGDIERTLQAVVDTNALNHLFSPMADGTRRTPGDAAVRFRCCDCDVVAHSDGSLIPGPGPAGNGSASGRQNGTPSSDG
ncbi:HalOD1 output domain-containing protein [Halorientalis salina]|uniref:HalOD1 output domain-containing protein n=1 Tax=Halorientalis salina TaxID=2932266 RepID=UPI0010AD6729|nr:HalOD1 output domain-containing protein [Halorientalis salina]